MEATDIWYNLPYKNANMSSIINLDNIDKKLSNNQLNWVLENTWQKAVTKYPKNKINLLFIIIYIIKFIFIIVRIVSINRRKNILNL